jgi:subtilisin-like proprotein convertase family protein
MSAEASKVNAKGDRARTPVGMRRRPARTGTYRRLDVDVLEARELLAVLPASTFPTSTVPISAVSGQGNMSTPSVAIDPNNPQKLAAVWTRNDPNLAPGPTEIVQWAYSVDGGKSWLGQGTPGGFGNALLDPTTSNPPVLLPQYSNASVAFDRSDNIYILYDGHRTDNSAGVLVMSKYALSTGTAQTVFTNNIVYKWVNDPATDPTLAVDNNLATFTDTDINGVTRTQNDVYSGNVYVAWTETDNAPAFQPNNFEPNRIRLVASSDGGSTFSDQQVLNDNGNYGSGANRPVTPRIAISQGSAPRAAGTNGSSDPGSPGVTPGQVSIVWDDYGVLSKSNPPLDQIYADRVTNGDVSQTFSANSGPIGDAGAGNPNSIPTTTDFPVTVNTTDPRFALQSITGVTVTLGIVHPALQELRIELIPPPSSGFSPLVLVTNQENAAGNTNTNIGISGANLGIATDGEAIGTTFDDNATRNIVDINPQNGNRGAAAPFVGHFRPEGGSLDQNFTGPNVTAGAPNTLNSINGTWIIRITDFHNNNVGFLVKGNITFTAGFTDNVDTNVAQTTVRAIASGQQVNSPAASFFGIGATPIIASDNTLGAYSPYQGRLYTAYVGRNTIQGNPADNTDIFLAYSDDGGINWTTSTVPVNSDLAIHDGYSEGSTGLVRDNTGRAQFQPQIAVDNATGTLVVQWLDAREDADRARVTTYLTTSIDGGQTYSPNVYANDNQTAKDAITGRTVILAPIPDNQSGVNANLNAGFGTSQGLAVYGGVAHPVWASNLNGGGNPSAPQPLGIRTNTMLFAAGPRVISITQGPVGEPTDSLNADRAADGTPVASAFVVTFDRPVDPTTFTPSDVRVLYRDATVSNTTGGFVPISSVVPLNAGPFGATQYQVNFAARSGVGTYSLEITSADIRDMIRTQKTAFTAVGSPVNFFASDLPQTVAPNGTAISTITVPANAFPANQFVQSLTVTLSVTTPDASSLTLTLISPSGTRILLANHAPFQFAGGQNYTNTTFDDKAAQGINSGTAPFTGSWQPVSPLNQLAGQTLTGNWRLEVDSSLTPLTGTFTGWSLSLQAGQATTVQVPGNLMDQNANSVAGQASDFFASPTPINPANGPFTGPFVSDTLPLIIPGPHVQSTSIPNAPATADNLVLDTSVSSIDIKFDRDMNPATVTAASVLQVMGPAGQINGPFTILKNPQGSDPDPLHPRTYRIVFPPQTLSGTYTVTLASTITDARGNALDTNLNAGVDLLRGTVTGATTSVVYNSALPLTIPDTRTVVSSLNVSDSYLSQGLTLQLNITHANDPDLQITLVSPNNISVVLVPYGTGTTGTKANFQNTIFDDNAPTPIGNGGPPFFGRFKPTQPLSAFNGVQVNGTWKLIISDDPTNPNGISGRLNSWSLTFQKGTSSTGLGEPVADQATASFRIFNTSPTNPLSSTTWTSVGPASVLDANNQALGNNGYAGRVGAIAVDPSDPSGNTVYVSGASGGVWKTTDFLTTNPQGPTYIPLTDFGPNSGMLVSSIAIFPRNNDPRQSIIIAGTGDGDTNYDQFGNTAYNTPNHGVGFLRSLDGGATWQLLDSTNNNLPFAARDHRFSVGTTNGFFGTGTEIEKVVVDPVKTSTGGVVIYAAVKSPFASNDGGLWKSTDTGLTWTKLSDNSLGDASDVVLDYKSATTDAFGNPTGNVNIVYAAFPGSGVYISPNGGQVLNHMAGGNVDPLIFDTITNTQVPVNNGANAPTGFPGSGRIVLAKPAVIAANAPNADIQNTLYEGWLYAAVADPFGHLDGVYLTKDYGQTWTKLQIYTLPDNGLVPRLAAPSNDGFTNPNYDVLGSRVFQHGNYNLALTVDPTNPNVVYLGGTANGNQSGLIRIDATRVYDSHAVSAYNGTYFDVGAPLQTSSTGRTQVDNNQRAPSQFVGTTSSIAASPGPYLNLLTDPSSPFQNNSTLEVFNVASFTNSGAGVRWTPLDQMLQSNATDFVPSSNVHRMVSYVDPTTGKTRLIVADDEGVFTAVLNADGTINPGPGTAVSPTYARNGNLAIEQFYYGSSQPSATAINGQVSALFYGNGINIGQTASDPNILTNGNIVGSGSTNGSPLGIISVTSGDQAGTGVGTDQQGNNVVYRYYQPLFGGNETDFFQVSTGGGPFISRTTGLVQTANDPQWPGQSQIYANGLAFGNFTVNPLDGQQVMISSNAGRIFSTINAGVQWLSIGEPGALDGSYAPALTYGAPDPNGPGGVGNLNNFLYAGTVNGNIFVTRTGGGNAWTKISTGLDGSPVVKIIADPTRGTHDAYAVTQKGVYFISDSTSAAASWTNITANLFSLTISPFGNASAAAPALTFLTSIQADWRYVIPNDPKNPAAGTHPLLYVSGDAGVYRSLDNGTTWAPFPNQAFDNSPADGGYLPNVQVNDLTVALGKVDPTTGRAVAQPGDPNVLLATTFGRGQFMIRLAPIVFPANLALDTKLPAPGGSVSGTDSQGRPIVTVAQPVIDGLSEQTAFGNTVRISILDLTDPNNPHIIGGYDPSQNSGSGNPTDIPANWTDSSGKFQVQVNATGFTSNGVKTIGIQATDASGTKGNIATLTFVLNAKLVSTTAPTAPQITMLASDDTSGGSFITSVKAPHIVGTTDAATTVQLFLKSVNGVPQNTLLGTMTSDALGKFSFLFPSSPDGIYIVQAVATNPNNNLSTTGNLFKFQISTTGPTITPVLTLSPADDTGIPGDMITSARQPHFVGQTNPGAIVSIYKAIDNGPGQQPTLIAPVLASVKADAVTGQFSIQLPFVLANGQITVAVSVKDAAGNPQPGQPQIISNALAITVVSVNGDYTVSGKTTPAVFRRTGTGAGYWFIQGVPPASGIPFGGSLVDIPFTGDFDGDGKADLALYRPSTNTWIINRSSFGMESFTLGTPGSLPAVGDFDGDGKLDAANYDPKTGTWYLAESTNGTQVVQFNAPGVFTPQPGDVPVPGNYAQPATGNGANPPIAELAVYRPSTGQFFIKGPGTGPGGTDNITVVAFATFAGWNSGDVPVPANYDDTVTYHATEPAVYDPSTGTYLILGQNGAVHSSVFSPGDVPAPGDYDGVGYTEPAVYHYNPATGVNTFIVHGPTTSTITYGGPGDIPVTSPLVYRNVVTKAPTLALSPASDTGLVGDNVTSSRRPFFTGKTDPNALVDLVDPTNGFKVLATGAADSTGTFNIQLSPNADLPNGTYTLQARAHSLGSSTGPLSPVLTFRLVTISGDYNGDGTTDPALFRRTTTAQWFVQGISALQGRSFGVGSTDIPIAADVDGDGKTDLLIYRPSTATWLVERAATGYAQDTPIAFGTAGGSEIPAPADFSGVGKVTLALFRPTSDEYFIYGQFGSVQVTPTGKAGDLPVPGNYDGTGKDEFAVYRPGVSAQWFIVGPSGTYSVFFGGANDVPVPGNYGSTPTFTATLPGVWRPSTGQYFIQTPGGGTQVFQFAAGDIPAPGDYEGKGMTEPAVYRPSTGQFLVVSPGQTTPHVLANFGGQGDIPTVSPYLYRALKSPAASGGTVKAASIDFGSTARSFSLGASDSTVVPTGTATTPAASPTAPPVIDFATRTRPRQALAAKHAHGMTGLSLLAKAAAKKGHGLFGG